MLDSKTYFLSAHLCAGPIEKAFVLVKKTGMYIAGHAQRQLVIRELRRGQLMLIEGIFF